MPDKKDTSGYANLFVKHEVPGPFASTPSFAPPAPQAAGHHVPAIKQDVKNRIFGLDEAIPSTPSIPSNTTSPSKVIVSDRPTLPAPSPLTPVVPMKVLELRLRDEILKRQGEPFSEDMVEAVLAFNGLWKGFGKNVPEGLKDNIILFLFEAGCEEDESIAKLYERLKEAGFRDKFADSNLFLEFIAGVSRLKKKMIVCDLQIYEIWKAFMPKAYVG